MVDPPNEEPETARRLVDRMIEERIRRARNEEALDLYDELLQSIWLRILPTLGRVTTMAILERSLELTRRKHPLLVDVEIGADGVVLAKLRDRFSDDDRLAVRRGLKELISNLIDLLAMLTGDILVRRLLDQVEGRRTDEPE